LARAAPAFCPSDKDAALSPWHNPRARNGYAIFRKGLIFIAVLLAIAIVIMLVR
jgi:hypothetical protein